MKTGSYRLVCGATVCVGLLLCLPTVADWPQFQGENRDGTSPETGLLREWPEGGPKQLWTIPLGAGFGGPAVRDGKVYVLDRVESREILRCLDLATGGELWNYGYDARGNVGHNGSRTTPTVDDRFVYSVGMMGHFLCVDQETHEPVWEKNLLKDFDMRRTRWGVAQSPSLYGDLVIVAAHASDAYVVAYKRKNGKVAWESEGLGLFGYSTPVVATLDGVDQIVMAGACRKGGGSPGRVAGMSVDKGKMLWSYEGWQCYIPIPYPTVLPDDRVFLTGGYEAGTAMIQVKRNGKKFEAKELFTTMECGSQIHQPLLFENHLYIGSNSNKRQDGLMCMTLDGEIKWRTKDTPGAPLFGRGNLLLADGMVIALDGKTGVLHLVEPSPEGYKELARAPMLGGTEIWAPMALSDGKLVLRDQGQMKCLDLRNP